MFSENSLLKVAYRAANRIQGEANRALYSAALDAGLVSGKSYDELAEGFYKGEARFQRHRDYAKLKKNNITVTDLTKARKRDDLILEHAQKMHDAAPQYGRGGSTLESYVESIKNHRKYSPEDASLHGGGVRPYAVQSAAGSREIVINKNIGYATAFKDHPQFAQDYIDSTGVLLSNEALAEEHVRGGILDKLKTMPKADRIPIIQKARAINDHIMMHEGHEIIYDDIYKKITSPDAMRSQGISVKDRANPTYTDDVTMRPSIHNSPSVVIEDHARLARSPADIKNTIEGFRDSGIRTQVINGIEVKDFPQSEMHQISKLTDGRVNIGSYPKHNYNNIPKEVHDLANKRSLLGNAAARHMSGRPGKGYMMHGDSLMTGISSGEVHKAYDAVADTKNSFIPNMEAIKEKAAERIVNPAYTMNTRLGEIAQKARESTILRSIKSKVPSMAESAQAMSETLGISVRPEVFKSMTDVIKNNASAIKLDKSLFNKKNIIGILKRVKPR